MRSQETVNAGITVNAGMGEQVARRRGVVEGASVFHKMLGVFVIWLAGLAAMAPAAGAAEFGFEPGSLYANLVDPVTGDPATQAGAAANLEFGFKMNLIDPALPQDPAGTIRDFYLDLPKGLVANPTRFDVCPMPNVLPFAAPDCPRTAAVGMSTVTIVDPGMGHTSPGFPLDSRVFRVPTQGDEAAAFGFSVFGGSVVVRMGATATPERGYRIRTSALRMGEASPMAETRITLWGIPAEYQGPGDFTCCEFGNSGGPLPPEQPRHRFLSVPSRCGGNPLRLDFTLDPWSSLYTRYQDSLDLPLPTGCEQLEFEPTITVTPGHDRAGQPAGYRVDVEVPQNEDQVDGLETPNLKDAVVTLPEGMVISPAQADGLDACTDAQFGLHENTTPACPASSKIGDVEIETPVLDDPVSGSIFVASQLSDDPESGNMFRLFVAARAPGVKIKLIGNIKADRQTGQLTATFADNPELPFNRFSLWFKGGERAALVNPGCGTHTATATFTPWGGSAASVTDTFSIGSGCHAAGFSPRFEAGSLNPAAGASSPFVLTGSRSDTDEEVRTIRQIQLPEGLLGRVGDVELCGAEAADVDICPAGSQVGRVETSVGAGLLPVWIPQAGKAPTSVSLAGPYRGAPYSLSIVVPAQAGPFDLGKVVVRSALHVNERTAQLATAVDQTRLYNRDGTLEQVLEGALPRVLKGVVLNQRELRVIMDRENFMVNPTSCAQKQVSAQAVSVTGRVADLSNRFRAVDCALLDFSPRINARIMDRGRRSTLRSFNPRMRFVVTPRPGDANIGRAAVTLPPSVILDQGNIRTVCTRAQFAERNCPEGSIYGHARAWSPLLRRPVQGPVYLGSSTNQLPDLIADLDGEVRIVLQGRIDTARGGRIRNTFETVPDAPVSRFVLQMRGGNRGILVNSTDLCRSNARGVANFLGQNGKRSVTRPPIALTYRGCGQVRKQATRKQAARQKAQRQAAAGRVARK